MSTTTKQCIDCGGVTTHGRPVGTPAFGSTWMCLWCHAGWEGWPRVGGWHPPKDDDRTYPEGKWEIAWGGGEETRLKRVALAARNNEPAQGATP